MLLLENVFLVVNIMDKHSSLFILSISDIEWKLTNIDLSFYSYKNIISRMCTKHSSLPVQGISDEKDSFLTVKPVFILINALAFLPREM